MGKTVDSHRIALEEEIHRWDGFARALRKEDRETFEELMDMCRGLASESSPTATQLWLWNIMEALEKGSWGFPAFHR